MQGFENYACNIIVLAHTTPPASRDFGVWRQSLLTELERIVRKHDRPSESPPAGDHCERLFVDLSTVLRLINAAGHLVTAIRSTLLSSCCTLCCGM